MRAQYLRLLKGSTIILLSSMLPFATFAGGGAGGGSGNGQGSSMSFGPEATPQGIADATNASAAESPSGIAGDPANSANYGGTNPFGVPAGAGFGVTKSMGLGTAVPAKTTVPVPKVVVPKIVVPKVVPPTTLPKNVNFTAKAKANYNNMDPKAKSMLASIASKVGFTITVTSTHRNHAHNTAVDGAKKSQHISGLAVDISTVGLTSTQKSQLGRAIASTQGVNGWGFYSNSVHADARQTTTKAAWGPNFSRTSLEQGLSHQPEMADSYDGWADSPATSAPAPAQTSDPDAAQESSDAAPASTNSSTDRTDSPGVPASPSTLSFGGGGTPADIGDSRGGGGSETTGNYRKSVACSTPLLDRLLRSSCETALVKPQRVESTQTSLLDPYPEADDDEYLEVDVTLKNGSQRSFVVPVLASGEERLAAAQSAGINIESEEVFAQVFGIPLENSTYAIEDVTRVTHEEQNKHPDTEGYEYRIYRVELTDDTVHSVWIHHEFTDEETETAFYSTGYIGDVEDLLSMSRAEAKDRAFLSSMITELKRLIIAMVEVISGEEEPGSVYADLQDLTTRISRFENGTSTIEMPSPQDIDENATSTVCTSEVKICADGSSVERIPPTCEFTACPLPLDTNEILFEVKVTDENGNIVTDWTEQGPLTLRQGEELAFRWDASSYGRCLPFIADNGTYSFSSGGDIRMAFGNTEVEKFDVVERTSTYRIECDGQVNGEEDVDERSIEVVVQ